MHFCMLKQHKHYTHELNYLKNSVTMSPVRQFSLNYAFLSSFAKDHIVIFICYFTSELTVQIKYKHAAENIFAFQLQPAQNHVSATESRTCPPVAAQAENMATPVAARGTFMETAVGKHGRVSRRQDPDAAGLVEVSSGFFANRTSPTDSAGSLTPAASSRESLLSGELDKERGCWMEPSSVTSPASLSRTVSPCSSVLSGIFSPAVVQIRKHFLAPGSSLIHTQQSCFTSCESLSSSSSSFCPQSPPPRRRPPLTRLSLLTAILRKGRLPVLSPAVQRPYTPCWPVNPVTLSFCNACSAASSVASIPLELSSQFSSTTSIDSQSHSRREPHRCPTAPAPPEHSASRWEQMISPPPVKPDTFSHTLLPRFCSDSGSASPAPQAHRAAAKIQHRPNVFISKSFKLEPRTAHVRGHADQLLTNSASSKHIRDQKKPGSPPDPAKNSSLSKLHMLSEKLRSPLRSSFHPSPSPSLADAASPLPPSRPTARRSHPDRSAKASEGTNKALNLPPASHSHACSPRWLSPVGSPTPTPSPAPPNRELSLSPSLSLRSTPSPRPESGVSDYSDREGKKRKVVIQTA